MPDPVGEAMARLAPLAQGIGGFIDADQLAADLRLLLSALSEAREGRNTLREAIEYVVDCDDSKWVEYFKDALAEADAARTGDKG